MSFSKSLALLSGLTLLCTVNAADVFTSFQDSTGAQIGSVTYDVGVTTCFMNNGATQIVFTQDGGASTADGPYCLSSYTAPDCSDAVVGQQSFSGVDLNTAILLDADVGNGPYHIWTTVAC